MFPNEKGIFSLSNGWNNVVSDMVKLHDIMVEKYPGVKYIMFGHSMGSFLTRTYIIDYPDKYDLAILSGTGHMGAAMLTGGALLADVFTLLQGAETTGKKLEAVAFGSYLKKIENPRTPYDWLTTVDSVVDKYIEDENCGFTCTNSLYKDMMHGLKYITNGKNIKKMSPEKPVYFMSGKEDPVGGYGDQVDTAYKAFCKAGLKDVSMKLYEGGRHEMLNESNKSQVMNDILNWIESKI